MDALTLARQIVDAVHQAGLDPGRARVALTIAQILLDDEETAQREVREARSDASSRAWFARGGTGRVPDIPLDNDRH